MIFLRNTGFKNVEHDFSRCSKELLARYLEEYLTTDIEIEIPELSALALDTMRYMLGMSESCAVEPEGELRDALREVMRIYVSVPLYFIHRLGKEINTHLQAGCCCTLNIALEFRVIKQRSRR